MNYFEQIQKLRYANIQYPVELSQAMTEANKHWVAFCAIPNDVKVSLTFTNYGGYELKQDPEKNDLKENIHYSQSKRQHFIDFADTLIDSQKDTVLNLVRSTDEVINLSVTLITDFLTDVEAGLHTDNLLQSILDYKDHWVVRYLHYFPVPTDVPQTAAAHCDIGGFTLHLFQDYKGLEYYDGTNWKEVPLENGLTSILLGIQMQHRTKGDVVATCHRVVPTEESAKTGRYSAVLFTNWPDGGNWDKASYGRLSNQAIGFNYDLSFEKLDGFFDTTVSLEES